MVSTEYIMNIILVISLTMSLIKMEKSIGLKINPCGRPWWMASKEEYLELQ